MARRNKRGPVAILSQPCVQLLFSSAYNPLVCRRTISVPVALIIWLWFRVIPARKGLLCLNGWGFIILGRNDLRISLWTSRPLQTIFARILPWPEGSCDCEEGCFTCAVGAKGIELYLGESVNSKLCLSQPLQALSVHVLPTFNPYLYCLSFFLNIKSSFARSIRPAQRVWSS